MDEERIPSFGIIIPPYIGFFKKQQKKRIKLHMSDFYLLICSGADYGVRFGMRDYRAWIPRPQKINSP